MVSFLKEMSKKMPIKVAIVENDPKFLEGVSLILEDSSSMEVVGRHTTGKDAIKGILEKRPDVALIDLGLPDISGGEEVLGLESFYLQ